MFDSKHVDAILGRETEPRSRSGPFGVTPPRIFCTFHATVSGKWSIIKRKEKKEVRKIVYLGALARSVLVRKSAQTHEAPRLSEDPFD